MKKIATLMCAVLVSVGCEKGMTTEAWTGEIGTTDNALATGTEQSAVEDRPVRGERSDDFVGEPAIEDARTSANAGSSSEDDPARKPRNGQTKTADTQSESSEAADSEQEEHGPESEEDPRAEARDPFEIIERKVLRYGFDKSDDETTE